MPKKERGPYPGKGLAALPPTQQGSYAPPERTASDAPMKGAKKFRGLISGQVRACRKAWGPTVECARCGTTIRAADAHADHIPVPFAAIVRMYLDVCALRRLEISAEGWRAFHATEATLKPSCAACNIAHNPRGESWHRRRAA